MTNNNGKGKRTGNSKKASSVRGKVGKKFPKKEATPKCFPQLLKVIKDYFKKLKKKRTQ